MSVEHVELGGEVLALDYSTLLCESCKARMEAARDAQRALQVLNAALGKSAPAAPPEPPRVPGALLSRKERFELAQTLLREGKAGAAAPPALPASSPIHTSGGTILAPTEAHRRMPKKVIAKRAEADVLKVAAGKMTKTQWKNRHGYSISLLDKRLDGLTGSGTPVNYVMPRDRVTQEHFDAVLNGEISQNRLAKQIGMPPGTLNRLVEKEKIRRRHALARETRAKRGGGTRNKPPTDHGTGLGTKPDGTPYKRRSPGSVAPTDAEMRAVYDGEITQNELARKYGCVASLISRRYEDWTAANRLDPRKRASSMGPPVEIDERDLIAYINRQVKAQPLADKYGCTAGLISIRAKTYALRFGLKTTAEGEHVLDEPEPAEGTAAEGAGPEQLLNGLQRVLAD